MIDIDVIYFDVDGTLIDARRDIVDAVNYMRSRFGLEPKPFREIVSCIGTGVRDLIEKTVVGDKGVRVSDALKVFGKRYLGHPADHAKLYPNVRSVLRHFRDKKKIILTNRFRRFALAALERFRLTGYFFDIIGGDDEKCMKPLACVVERSLKRLKADRSRAIIVGDMDIDVMTARNSGIKSCFVTHGLGKLKDVKKLKPDYVIDDLSELKRIIKREVA